jgi:hypothetical protein
VDPDPKFFAVYGYGSGKNNFGSTTLLSNPEASENGFDLLSWDCNIEL